MVPSTFTAIASIPVTINGKLDKRALPEPQWTSKANMPSRAAIRNPAVRHLAAGVKTSANWCRRQLSHRRRFHCGDSVSIESPSGLSITSESHFRSAYRGAVGSVTGKPTKPLKLMPSNDLPIGQEAKLLGEFALLPIQQWFFDRCFVKPDHWNQAFMVQLPAGMTTAMLSVALTQLAIRHDMLRTGYENR